MGAWSQLSLPQWASGRSGWFQLPGPWCYMLVSTESGLRSHHGPHRWIIVAGSESLTSCSVLGWYQVSHVACEGPSYSTFPEWPRGSSWWPYSPIASPGSDSLINTQSSNSASRGPHSWEGPLLLAILVISDCWLAPEPHSLCLVKIKARPNNLLTKLSD